MCYLTHRLSIELDVRGKHRLFLHTASIVVESHSLRSTCNSQWQLNAAQQRKLRHTAEQKKQQQRAGQQAGIAHESKLQMKIHSTS